MSALKFDLEGGWAMPDVTQKYHASLLTDFHMDLEEGNPQADSIYKSVPGTLASKSYECQKKRSGHF